MVDEETLNQQPKNLTEFLVLLYFRFVKSMREVMFEKIDSGIAEVSGGRDLHLYT